MKKLILATLISTMALGASLSLPAADKPADTPAETKPAPKFRPFRGKVSATDKTAKSITLEGEKAQTFLITSQTRIFKERKPATFDDIMAGDMVGGRAQEKDGKWEAATINVGIAPPLKPKEGEKKPEEPKK